MNSRRGFSDSKLSKWLKNNDDEEDFDNILPKCLLKDIDSLNIGEHPNKKYEKNSNIIEPDEEEPDYFKNLDEIMVSFIFK